MNKIYPYLGSNLNYRDNSTDGVVIKEVFIDKVYELPMYIKKEPIIVDIGAHIGAFSLFARKKFPRSKIIAYEPQKDNFDLLKRNVDDNNLNVIYHNKAVSSKKGELEMFLAENNHTAGHSILSKSVGIGEKVKIESITLNDVFTENNIEIINLLKMDCEGAEYEIILNSKKDDLERIDNILMEYHEFKDKDKKFEDIENFLTKNGFFLAYNRQTNTNDMLTVGNAVFVNKRLMKGKEITDFIDNYFDKIYLINLDRRKDRLEHVTKQFENANIKTVERFPGIEISDEEYEKYPKELVYGLQVFNTDEKLREKYIRASIGVRQAHLNCIKHAKENGFKKILIFEDDIIIRPDSNILFQDVISKIGNGWDLLYLGGDYRENNVTFHLSSYALDANTFDFIIENMEKSGIEDDYFFVRYVQKGFKTLRVSPMLMTQSKADSDIQIVEECMK